MFMNRSPHPFDGSADSASVNRRSFLVSAGATCLGCLGCIGAGSPAAGFLVGTPASRNRTQAPSEAFPPKPSGSSTDTPAFTPVREIDYYDQLPQQKIQCHVCPLDCTLKPGETCFCQTRTNVDGRLYSRAYNNPCILRVDEVEKLPLNHYRPGTRTLTLGVGGCNLRCLYCQNWQMSQSLPDRLKVFNMTPDDVIAAARKQKIDTIAFSYTEPIAFLEYALDIAKKARQAGMHVIVATAAFVKTEPLLELARYVDAFAVSLKGFDEAFYHRVTGVRLAPVLDAIKTIKHKTPSWLELVNLVVPGYNDDPDTIARMVAWIRAEVGDDTPIHFARFVPMYQLSNLPKTPVQALEKSCELARQAGIRYVYTSNIAPHDGTSTQCANCGARLIERLGFKVLSNEVRNGKCPKCGLRLPGVWS